MIARLFVLRNKEPYSSIHRMLGFYPNKAWLYEQAFTHRSSHNTPEGRSTGDNERLEFLGDAVLGIAVADILYKHFPNKNEGFLTSTRSKIVQRETLNRIAIEMGLDKMMVSTVRPQTHNSYILGNALEALIGAIYLDQGYRRCRQFVQERIIDCYTPLDKVAQKEVNFKSYLLEWGQKAKLHITFVLIETSMDKDGNRMFQSTVNVEGVPFGSGTGYTKKESQQIAAKKAIKKIRYDREAQTLIADLRKRAFEAKEAANASADTPAAPEAEAVAEAVVEEGIG